MDIRLIQLYLLVCHAYDTQPETCFQRLSNNSKPAFTDQELVTIHLFAHCNEKSEKKAIHRFIDQHWRHFLPLLPAYQPSVARLNRLEQTFQAAGGYLQGVLRDHLAPEVGHVIDSLPVMPAQGGHASAARVACAAASVGYCASKETYFRGVRLHAIAQRRCGVMPLPRHIWSRGGACHDLASVREREISLPEGTLIGDKAFADPVFQEGLGRQQTTLYTPLRKPGGAALTPGREYYDRLGSRLRRPIESFLNRLSDKTDMQRAGTARSAEGLMIRCWGKLTLAFYLLVFNP